MSPALNGNTVLQYFERGNAVEIHNGIMFDFYPGLSYIYMLYMYYKCDWLQVKATDTAISI